MGNIKEIIQLSVDMQISFYPKVQILLSFAYQFEECICWV